jgi:type VI protein secretion system component Hcp
MAFPNAVLVGQRLDGMQQVFLTITLSNVLVTSYKPAASNSDLPKEQFSLSYTRIRTVYQQVNPDGTLGDPVVSCWDIPANRSC